MSSSAPGSTRDHILAAAESLLRERGISATLEEIAETAGVSRQTLYLHFGSRSGLLVAMVQWMDGRGPLPSLIEHVFGAPTAPEALDAIANLHAEYHPLIYPVARAFLSGRYEDDAMRLAWDERMESRRNLYHQIVEWLDRDGLLMAHWDIETGTDVLWSMTSFQVWEQLVLDRGWPKERYLDQLRTLLRRILVRGDEPESHEGKARHEPKRRKKFH